jgi:hypothetical protein
MQLPLGWITVMDALLVAADVLVDGITSVLEAAVSIKAVVDKSGGLEQPSHVGTSLLIRYKLLLHLTSPLGGTVNWVLANPCCLCCCLLCWCGWQWCCVRAFSKCMRCWSGPPLLCTNGSRNIRYDPSRVRWVSNVLGKDGCWCRLERLKQLGSKDVQWRHLCLQLLSQGICLWQLAC